MSDQLRLELDFGQKKWVHTTFIRLSGAPNKEFYLAFKGPATTQRVKILSAGTFIACYPMDAINKVCRLCKVGKECSEMNVTLLQLI